ncbi:MAG: SUMF1/EgtB/PvdO family nonheme iron enzyme [Tychonema bourrellyi B0820]|nr:SUMF1/EgtB/PvdO family nonheme iron enzyme [Tychonema bourrellyi B0820]
MLIGVSEYQPGLNPLPAAVKDIEALQRVLQDPEMGGFDEVKTLANPEPHAMQLAIETLFDSRAKDDLILLFFSGHGIKDDAGRLYFASRSTRKNPKGNLIKSTAISASFVHEIMNNSRAKRQAIILDCCFSGAFDPGLQAKDDGSVDLRTQLGAEGRVVLTSSSSTEYSFEQQGSDLSIYTRYLVEGIETGAGDTNSDGLVSILELHEYAVSKVQEELPAMTPKIIVLKDKGFEIVLAKARVADPKLKYRKAASRYANVGTIRPAGRAILNTLRQQLGLTADETAEIEAEVLRPYQERLANLQKYRETLIAEAEHEYPLSEFAREELNTLQQMLLLRDGDVLPIQQEIEALFTQQAEAKRQAQEQAKTSQVSSPQNNVGTKLQRFEFDVITVDKTGKENSRTKKSAEVFAEDLGNGVLLEMVQIPQGSFLMGSPKNELERRDNEGPQHQVTVPAFLMGKYAVTQAQWKTVANLPQLERKLRPDPSSFKGANRPVEFVSWYHAVEFCARLSQHTGKPYRLPSEAEWEYACRAGTTTPFHFGETITTDLANYRGTDNEEYKWSGSYGAGPKGIDREETTPVGSFRVANAFGLYDMHGNVWEWCADPWHSGYQGAPTDGTVWDEICNDNRYQNNIHLLINTKEDKRTQVLRGGSWRADPGDCRAAIRNNVQPRIAANVFGFRVVCVAAWT